MNPFLTKPLKKIQTGTTFRNTSLEQRPSRLLIPNMARKQNQARRPVEAQKLKNPSPISKNQNNNNINLVNLKIIKDNDTKNTNTKPEISNEPEKKINQKINNEPIIKKEEKKEEKKLYLVTLMIF